MTIEELGEATEHTSQAVHDQRKRGIERGSVFAPCGDRWMCRVFDGRWEAMAVGWTEWQAEALAYCHLRAVRGY
jgi:hypothetical protein